MTGLAVRPLGMGDVNGLPTGVGCVNAATMSANCPAGTSASSTTGCTADHTP
jgi:hypothetical protein